MNILHVTAAYTPFVGGATTYVAEISRRLAQAGHRVTVLTTDIRSIDLTWSPNGARVDAPVEIIDGVNVRRLRVKHLPFAPLSFYALRRFMPALGQIAPLSLLRWLGGYIPRLEQPQRVISELSAQHGPFDLVHLINITIESPLLHAARFARTHGIRTICTPFVHIGSAEVMRNYTMSHQLELMRSSSQVFVQTERERVAVARLGIPDSAVHVLGMGVDLQASAGADGARFRAAHRIPDSAPIVLFMGSITRDKGALTLLRAMRTLWRDWPHARVVFAGEAPGPGGFAEALAALQADERARVLLPGTLNGAHKHDAFAACALFAMPSRVDSFGIVYLEAWQHGKPVIGADAGGVPDVISHAQDGLIIPFDDHAQLAQHIGALLRDPARANQLGAQGRVKVEAHYTWDAIMGKLSSVLN